MSEQRAASVLAFPVPSLDDLNPISYLGHTIAESVADAWTTAMLALWQAGLWLTMWVFRMVSALGTPDLSAAGPLGKILPTTLWISSVLALILLFVQCVILLVRRDGQSLGRVALGLLQYVMVWASFLGIAAALVLAAAGLERAILSATLDIDTLSAYRATAGWVRGPVDAASATVLGVTALLLVIPAGFFGLILALMRVAALLVLGATMPITAATVMADPTKPIFWKSVRWFLVAVLMTPTGALVLGIGVQVSNGLTQGDGDETAAAVGSSIVGAVMIAVALVCPVALYRLVAWVDPGTPSGAALRQTWADASRSVSAAGPREHAGQPTAAQAFGADGRAQGEATAEATTGSPMSGALAMLGQGIQVVTSVANRASDLSADILTGAGVGSPGYSMTPADERALRGSASGGSPAPGGPADGQDPNEWTPNSARSKPRPPGGGGPPAGAGGAGGSVPVAPL